MPRQRPRRRRRRASSPEATASTSLDEMQIERVEQSRRRWLPTAGIVASLGLGIWVGWTFANVGGFVEQIALWVGVLMAGFGGGRLFRRSLQSRRNRDR